MAFGYDVHDAVGDHKVVEITMSSTLRISDVVDMMREVSIICRACLSQPSLQVFRQDIGGDDKVMSLVARRSDLGEAAPAA